MAIKWTASSEAVRQACGKAAARWGNTHAVTGTAEAGTVTVADLNITARGHLRHYLRNRPSPSQPLRL
jgi:hypothetical protein